MGCDDHFGKQTKNFEEAFHICYAFMPVSHIQVGDIMHLSGHTNVRSLKRVKNITRLLYVFSKLRFHGRSTPQRAGIRNGGKLDVACTGESGSKNIGRIK